MVKPYRAHVFVCTASGAGAEMHTPADPARCRFCSDKGGEAVRERFWTELERAGIEDVKVTRMGCTVQHKHGPIVIVYPDGVWYAGVTVADVAEIVASHLGAGVPVARLVHHRMGEEVASR
jgi:(2Fe-2S) ferredoxin